MELGQYYQSGRYSKNATEWRDSFYFPLRIKWIIDNLPAKFQGRILDAGCGDGTMLTNLKKHHPSIRMYGTDISKEGCRLARERGIIAKISDLNHKIPFKNNFFDFIIAHEVIEHLTDPDEFLEECNRTLKKGGYLVVTTPNLTAWYHRILFLFGLYPLFSELSTRERKVGIGILKYVIKSNQPVGHIRIFTAAALKDLIKLYGFSIKKVKGAPIPFNFPKIIGWIYDTFDFIFSFFPSLSSNILIVAKKKGPHAESG